MRDESLHIKNQNGFSLIELMVALVLSSLVIIAVYAAYTIQQKTYTAQIGVVEMQQNLRVGLDIMTQEIRMAGYDPSGSGSAGAGITAATATQLSFSADYNEDGDVTDAGENIAFYLYVDDDGVSVLGRSTDDEPITFPLPAGVAESPLANNIEHLEFLYTLDDDTRTLTPTNTQLDNIVAIQVSLLAIASQRDANFPLSGEKMYQPASATTADTVGGTCTAAGVGCVSTKDWTPTKAGFRRRFVTTTINCRNMRLK